MALPRPHRRRAQTAPAAPAQYAVSPRHSSSCSTPANPLPQSSSPAPKHRSPAAAVPPASPSADRLAPPRTHRGLSTTPAPAAAKAPASIRMGVPHSPTLRDLAHTSPPPHLPFSATPPPPFLFLQESSVHPACRHPSSTAPAPPSNHP